MIAQVRTIWGFRDRRTVIVRDQADGRLKKCYVWLTTANGQWIASLCEAISEQGELGVSRKPDLIGAEVVLTLRPQTAWGWEIEKAELMGLGR